MGSVDEGSSSAFDITPFPQMSQRTVPSCDFWFDASRQQMNNASDFNFPMANPDSLGYMNGHNLGHNFISSHTGPSEIAEEAARRREIRLMKNREAARECRRKKKEYVKCLENRVGVLEEQNRSLIEELQNLKDIHSNSTRNMAKSLKSEAL
ncbi:unnamed protein product [Oikopleura dioica]|uniref:BZIP domain-containing protein n=1 Tax=Oikopleura dioica TaxID=34765 RepID=E4XUB0_OIKDI|nr:unnamed protein product [Oikopleura dioica]CBY36681.1 unnamed protein product [Oikopleura dioica]